jgi:predicted small metal-binding protein
MSGTSIVRIATTAVKREDGEGVKSLSCADGGVVCKATITGETEEEVLARAVEHARVKHGVDLTDSQTLARYAQNLIRDDGRSSSDHEPREQAAS